jgi:hypothetical protein
VFLFSEYCFQKHDPMEHPQSGDMYTSAQHKVWLVKKTRSFSCIAVRRSAEALGLCRSSPLAHCFKKGPIETGNVRVEGGLSCVTSLVAFCVHLASRSFYVFVLNFTHFHRSLKEL